MKQLKVEATAPGKMILFGEHSVVYRGPAVVLAIDRRARVVAEPRDDEKIFIDADDLGFSGYFENDVYHPVRGKAWRGRNLAALNVAAKKTMEHIGEGTGVNLIVRSMIPIAVGLGSSAAICVATAAAVAGVFEGVLDEKQISDLAFEGERIIHGTPSGVDNNVATFGGIMRYERGVGFERFHLDEVFPFIIGNTRKRRSTRMLVEGVARLKERNPALVDSIIDTMGELSGRGLDALLRRDLQRLGDFMNLNHGLLSAIGVSTPQLDALVHAARRNGALGAKLTGAGGGGCMIALAEAHKLTGVEKAIRRRRGESIKVSLTDEGVKTRVLE